MVSKYHFLEIAMLRAIFPSQPNAGSSLCLFKMWVCPDAALVNHDMPHWKMATTWQNASHFRPDLVGRWVSNFGELKLHPYDPYGYYPPWLSTSGSSRTKIHASTVEVLVQGSAGTRALDIALAPGPDWGTSVHLTVPRWGSKPISFTRIPGFGPRKTYVLHPLCSQFAVQSRCAGGSTIYWDGYEGCHSQMKEICPQQDSCWAVFPAVLQFIFNLNNALFLVFWVCQEWGWFTHLPSSICFCRYGMILYGNITF